ncbi:alkaline phosphatase [Fusibacter bizertensis]|uniref:Alkaline phosphatase n=1 Tax=Fusibacter bizertensis TaxID=1488331 RepID=A0ABT6N8M4_9FIRM|nr:alkaline phosphatase [Fusibacter bizertensis]MDH8676767.1 alkaline phosphatase [Fusibacter bizertensis]
MKRRSKFKSILGLVLVISLFFSNGTGYAVTLDQVKSNFAKNVIIMIPDGMSHDGVTLSRWVYNDGKALNMDALASGLVTTNNSDTAIADSAPAGTAMATGYKTQDKLVGVKPAKTTLEGAREVTEGDAFAPAASILEAAKLAGKSVGIIATSEIQHATPADFSSHVIHRNMYTTIGEQQVYQNMDVVLGGGRDYLLPDTKNSTEPLNKMRIDHENMQDAIKSMGYNFVTTRAEMLNTQSGKLWGAFSPKAMNKDMIKSDEEPSLAEMTDKAIELLSQNDEGFFLMVEGSQVDWAAHGNQTVGLISEIKAFDEAVGVALDFAKSNADTLIIIASDHGNGGISIGDASTSGNYSTLPIAYFTDTLKKAKVTEEAAAAMIDTERSNIVEVMKQLGILDLSAEEVETIKLSKGIDENGKAYDKTLVEISKVVSTHAHIGWTTGGHTGEDVVLYVYANSFENQLSGTVQNSDIALYAAKAMGLDLDKATDELFVPQKDLSKFGFDVTIDASDITNPKLVLLKADQKYLFEENKNFFISDGVKSTFNGITVFNGTQFFIPQAAIDMISPQVASTYTIQAGDVLWKIAADQHTTMEILIELNNLSNPNFLKVGQVINLPK